MKRKRKYDFDYYLDEDDPDFYYYETDDPKEEEHNRYIMYLFLIMYIDYKNQEMDYITRNIGKDLKTLEGNINQAHQPVIEENFIQERDKTLEEAGILKQNINKTGIKDSLIRPLLNEQKITLKNIFSELEGQIRSKAEYLKNKFLEHDFEIKSNFDKAAKRLKKMLSSGWWNAKGKGKHLAREFLYGRDSLVNWVTMGDSDVCPECRALEKSNPHQLKDITYPPLHHHCRCEIEQLTTRLTDAARSLTKFREKIDNFSVDINDIFVIEEFPFSNPSQTRW